MSAENPPIRIVTDDKTRFLLLEITGLDFAVSWLPITRVQLELFLSDVYDARYDANWYMNQVLKDNPRVSPNNVTPKNVNGILATNILLTEARRIADWFGYEKGQIYDLPTTQQWAQIYDVCNRVEMQTQLPEGIDPRARVMVTRLQKLSGARTLADQMLINSTISEYVYSDESRQTCQITGGRKGGITALTKAFQQEGSRRTNLAFRLIRRAV